MSTRLIIFSSILIMLIGSLIGNFPYYEKRYIIYANIYKNNFYFIKEKTFKIIQYIFIFITYSFLVFCMLINELSNKDFFILKILGVLLISGFIIFLFWILTSFITDKIYEKILFHYHPTVFPLTEDYEGFTEYGKNEIKEIKNKINKNTPSKN